MKQPLRRTPSLRLLSWLCAFLLFALPLGAIEVGDRVRLDATNPQGVPLHAGPAPDMIDRAPDGAVAVVTATEAGGWLQIRFEDDQTAWIVDRYVGEILDAPPPAPPTDPPPAPPAPEPVTLDVPPVDVPPIPIPPINVPIAGAPPIDLPPIQIPPIQIPPITVPADSTPSPEPPPAPQPPAPQPPAPQPPTPQPPTPEPPGSSNLYYAAVDASTPETLRASLHEIIDDHRRLPYSSSSTDTWDVVEEADRDPDQPRHVVAVYQNFAYEEADGSNSRYNREHSWPKSYGFKADHPGNYPYTDCHHLFISNTKYNADRGNRPFGWCDDSCQVRKAMPNNGDGGDPDDVNRYRKSGQEVWEVWPGRRGDIARAMFYMDVRYEGGDHIDGSWEPDLILTDDLSQLRSSRRNERVAHMGDLSTLLEWHRQDPPDDFERRRNEVIFLHQGNRNPFTDHPEWAECVFARICD